MHEAERIIYSQMKKSKTSNKVSRLQHYVPDPDSRSRHLQRILVFTKEMVRKAKQVVLSLIAYFWKTYYLKNNNAEE